MSLKIGKLKGRTNVLVNIMYIIRIEQMFDKFMQTNV